MKLAFQCFQIEIQLGLECEDREIIALLRRLDLAAVRAKKCELVMRYRTRPDSTGTAESMTFNMSEALLARVCYDEKDEPQPQEREEFGLMKLNPCRINVSS